MRDVDGDPRDGPGGREPFGRARAGSAHPLPDERELLLARFDTHAAGPTIRGRPAARGLRLAGDGASGTRGGGTQRVDAVGALPGEVRQLAAEVAVRRGLA